MSSTQLYLASSSPRRRALLEQVGVRYEVVGAAVEEAWDGHETPSDYVLRLSLEKAQAGRQALNSGHSLPILAADTAVVLDGQVLGKPAGREHALAMLEQLSGRSHRVLTAVALVDETRYAVRLSASTVNFAAVTAWQRAAYWASGEAIGKAGAYAIQGRAAAFISHLEGSYSGVMGLPLFETVELLREFGIEIFQS